MTAMNDRFRDEYLRTPTYSPRPIRQIIEGRIWDAVYQSGIPRGDVEREIVHRVLGALGPLIAIADLQTATDDELKQIFGRANPALHTRLQYDPEFAAVVHVAVGLRRQLDRLAANQTIPEEHRARVHPMESLLKRAQAATDKVHGTGIDE